jgi:hypothetical protein
MNPFRFGSPVAGDHFVGREKMVRQVIDAVRTGQNLVLFGERRQGKTSILLEAARRAETLHLWVDLNLVQDEADLIGRLRNGLHDLIRSSPMNVRLRDLLDRARFGIFGSLDAGGMMALPLPYVKERTLDTVQQFFAAVQTLHAQIPFLIVFDEFQGLLELKSAGSLQGVMRGEIQRQQKIPYLFAGSMRHQMYEMFMNPANPFYNFAIPIEVGPLPETEFVPYLEQCFVSGGRATDVACLQQIYRLVAGNTGDVQKLCYYLWNVTSAGDRIDTAAIRRGIAEVCEAEHLLYERSLSQLNASQTRVLVTLALIDGEAPYGRQARQLLGTEGQATTIQRALAKLVKENFIYQRPDEERYRFSSPFFRAWLLERERPGALLSAWPFSDAVAAVSASPMPASSPSLPKNRK